MGDVDVSNGSYALYANSGEGNDVDDHKELTELDKYWKAVRDNPQDFTGWTYLLQYVEQENDLEAAREAFNTFFKRYPYCYGYWKKFADLEKRNDNIEKCMEVYERGVVAIPLSIDLWQHYITFYRAQFSVGEHEEKIRSLHERSVQAAGLEFRSDRLWEIYIAFELECKSLRNAMAVYDRLVATPTQLYSHHFEKFEEFVRENHPRDLLSSEEFLALRTEVTKAQKGKAAAAPPPPPPPPPSDAKDGETTTATSQSPPPSSDASSTASDAKKDDEEASAVRDKILESRRAIHKINEEEVSRRWNFEEGIKRPYFHVKPLERTQLKNWRDYLDFELENGSHERVVVLYERCLIACALYEDLWLRYAKYMEAFNQEKARDVYLRACSIHLPMKPNIHLAWASYEEKSCNFAKAMEVLDFLEKAFPTYIPAMFRRIGVVRRTGKPVDVEALFKRYIDAAKSPQVASLYAIKQARYRFKVCGDFEGAKQVLTKAIENDKDNAKLYLQLVDMYYQVTPLDEGAVVRAFDMALEGDASQDTKLMLAQRKVEFLEDLGSDVLRLQEAYNELSNLTRCGYEKRKRGLEDGSDDYLKDKRMKVELNGVSSSASLPMAQAAAVPMASTATPTADQSAYGYTWAGYAQNYNYQTAWNMYNQSYYAQQ